MFRLAWATDLHLDFVRDKPQVFNKFVDSIKKKNADALLITGDIAEGATWVQWLVLLRDELSIPVYFVLGNHDRWGSSFRETDALAKELSDAAPHSPKWLTSKRIIKLTPTTSLVGHDGWYDCNGLRHPMTMLMNDWFSIEEFRPIPGMYVGSGTANIETISRISFELANAAGKHLQDVVVEAFKDGAKTVVCATHVPPFCEASYHNGALSPPETMPLYSAPVIGARLCYVMEEWSDRQLIILSGHTHQRATFRAMPNLLVHVGGAQYGGPRLADIFDL